MHSTAKPAGESSQVTGGGKTGRPGVGSGRVGKSGAYHFPPDNDLTRIGGCWYFGWDRVESAASRVPATPTTHAPTLARSLDSNSTLQLYNTLVQQLWPFPHTMATSLAVPIAYITVLVTSLAIFSRVYRRRRAGKWQLSWLDGWLCNQPTSSHLPSTLPPAINQQISPVKAPIHLPLHLPCITVLTPSREDVVRAMVPCTPRARHLHHAPVG